MVQNINKNKQLLYIIDVSSQVFYMYSMYSALKGLGTFSLLKKIALRVAFASYP